MPALRVRIIIIIIIIIIIADPPGVHRGRRQRRAASRRGVRAAAAADEDWRPGTVWSQAGDRQRPSRQEIEHADGRLVDPPVGLV